ncbi:hypothetical protein POM88_035574 [Heracleum sosnowskyi]|uniref:Uncharacterized protein n=1 Tax=Heracleum sosnowskyi TaxID=360622 RepID=A0AAD8ME33_9APIA|nr:hypothetical protein POM88_035574 [Heracleum sosnowskyi]
MTFGLWGGGSGPPSLSSTPSSWGNVTSYEKFIWQAISDSPYQSLCLKTYSKFTVIGFKRQFGGRHSASESLIDQGPYVNLADGMVSAIGMSHTQIIFQVKQKLLVYQLLKITKKI